jgi:hypothetical protein
MELRLLETTGQRSLTALPLATALSSIALLVCLAAVGSAQPRKGGALPGPHAGIPQRMGAAKGQPGPRAAKALERLNNMTPEQRERALQKLPPERRERMQRQLDAYNKLSPEQRDRLHRQVEAFQQLPPERQDEVRKAFRHYNNLQPERQTIVHDELQTLRRLSPDERRARLESDEFHSRFRPGEQKLIENLADVMPEQ